MAQGAVDRRWERSTRRMISSFSVAGYLMCRGRHPRSCFFKQPVLKQLRGKGFLEIMRLHTQRLHFLTGGCARRVARKTFLARFQKFLRPTVIQALGDALLAAQPRQYDPDLLFRGSMSTRLVPDVANRLFNRVFLPHGFLPHLRSFRSLR